MGISMKSTPGKILASVTLVGAAAAVAGLGTYGAFTSTTNASQEVKAGRVVIELGGTVNTISNPVAGLLPGDSVEKFVTLSNTGDSDFNAVTLTTTASTGTLLTSDVLNGLQLTVEACSTDWVTVANGPDTCAGSKTVVVASTPILGTRVLTAPASLTATKSDRLKITTSLPTSAGEDFQGLTSTVNFKFDATQRTASVK
ncbi:spore coat-associated protein N [Pseudarthrobacter siccitolerans]|uniref:Spore coat-associated protein N n=1 Tax=Pseudarthrobacter siccitolerans TaxID=861266 RepID=A0ABU0PIV3_9MICC|nr:TasA family protein [Pseudarthrobacter siccitolerans]MDQ0673898.1 spore coat-associated protein N [Pseudarthrobacter siccitolerans]